MSRPAETPWGRYDTCGACGAPPAVRCTSLTSVGRPLKVPHQGRLMFGNGRFSDRERARAVQLYQGDSSIRAIADELGRSMEGVRQSLIASGVQIRRPGRRRQRSRPPSGRTLEEIKMRRPWA